MNEKFKVGDIVETRFGGSLSYPELGVIVDYNTIYKFPYTIRLFSNKHSYGVNTKELRIIGRLSKLEIELLTE